ncbi:MULTISPECIES: hypothetical protein [unclassified Fibrobacter]|uniref:hypothetical protein n=1 Tax=unclassified Fibrobacter TaxID=2634177 RepID=UPI000D79A2A6|nr:MULTISPECIES: hypothetical protein [unclassified Fibrobacter]PWJ71909.1 hypothetical protein BGX12_101148 [Fibrobacter sp. UWR4]PZW70358.1 hypothetical protein C8E88_101215 [Fibrobacter sp. UWR1]
MLKRICLGLAMCGMAHADESDLIIEFLRDMLEKNKFESYPFLTAHCSGNLLKKLEADYDYECDNGPCYAVWNFREGANDVWTWKILDIKLDDDGWYTYSFQENEFIGKHRVKARMENGSVILDDLK